MSTLKPLNDQPVVLTLSFESVLKISDALENVKRGISNAARHNRQEAIDESNSNFYLSIVQSRNLQLELTCLSDLQRVITCMLDNVADKYADELLQNDKEMQAAMRQEPTKLSEQAVDAIVKHWDSKRDATTKALNDYALKCEDSNSAKADSVTTNL